MGYMQSRTPHLIRCIFALDHGNAPYGNIKERDRLVFFVGQGLQTLQKLRAKVIASVCNTLGVTFPDSLKGIDIPVLNLIDVVSQAVGTGRYGKNPAMIGTIRTRDEPMYPDLIKKYSKDEVKPQMFGSEHWARIVNEGLHLSEDPEVIENVVMPAVREVTDQIPDDASAWILVCTHFDALRKFIERARDERGLNHIPVIDPIVHQADALADVINQMEDLPEHEIPYNKPDMSPLVVTSAKTQAEFESVVKLGRDLLGKGATFVNAELSGKEFDISLVRPWLESPYGSLPLQTTDDMRAQAALARDDLSGPHWDEAAKHAAAAGQSKARTLRERLKASLTDRFKGNSTS